MTNRNIFQRKIIVLFTALLVLFGISEIRSQVVEIIDSKTGKSIDKSKMPRFFSTFVADGFISKTKIKFGAYVFLTNFDDNRITKTIFYSDSEKEIKEYFQRLISESAKIIERKKATERNQTTERIVIFSKDESGEEYSILAFKGGKSFISISAKNLEIIEEFEKFSLKTSNKAK